MRLNLLLIVASTQIRNVVGRNLVGGEIVKPKREREELSRGEVGREGLENSAVVKRRIVLFSDLSIHQARKDSGNDSSQPISPVIASWCLGFV